MEVKFQNNESPNQHMAGEPCGASAAAHNILDRGTEVYGQAEQAVSDVYDKTAKAVSETYTQARNYSSENPGKTILIAVGIGAGLGFLLGVSSSSHRSRGGRFAQPVVSALSDLVQEFFR